MYVLEVKGVILNIKKAYTAKYRLFYFMNGGPTRIRT